MVCDEVDIDEVKDYNKPLLLNISNANESDRFVVIKSYDEKAGFAIEDPLHGNYYATDKGLVGMWKDRKCIAFISKSKKNEKKYLQKVSNE